MPNTPSAKCSCCENIVPCQPCPSCRNLVCESCKWESGCKICKRDSWIKEVRRRKWAKAAEDAGYIPKEDAEQIRKEIKELRAENEKLKLEGTEKTPQRKYSLEELCADAELLNSEIARLETEVTGKENYLALLQSIGKPKKKSRTKPK